MGLEKTIVSGREQRKLYHGAKVADCNHGFCNYCKSNQLHSTRQREAAVDTHQRECDSYNCGGENRRSCFLWQSLGREARKS